MDIKLCFIILPLDRIKRLEGGLCSSYNNINHFTKKEEHSS